MAILCKIIYGCFCVVLFQLTACEFVDHCELIVGRELREGKWIVFCRIQSSKRANDADVMYGNETERWEFVT